MVARRTLLHTAGAAVLAPSAGRHGWVVRPAAAAASDPTLPWRQVAAAADDADPRVRALGWAVLAPNPHNRQPWLARLPADRPDEAWLHCDLDRRLPATDPLDRQILIGLGCFAELFRLAAAEEGRAVAIDPFPEGAPAGPRLDAKPVARLRLGPPGSAAPDPLFRHAAARRSAKRPFDAARPVSAETFPALRAAALEPGAVGGTAEQGRVAALRDLVWRAWTVELETRPAHMESVGLMRLGSAEVAANPDGISVLGPGVDEMVARGALTRDAFAEPGRPGHAMMVERYRTMLGATNAYVWTRSADDSRAAQFDAGRDWLRLNLAATGLGLGLHPVSQALQEYPEMAGPFAEAHRLLGVSAPGRVQMLARLGHLAGPAPGPTPRWPAASRILGA